MQRPWRWEECDEPSSLSLNLFSEGHAACSGFIRADSIGLIWFDAWIPWAFWVGYMFCILNVLCKRSKHRNWMPMSRWSVCFFKRPTCQHIKILCHTMPDLRRLNLTWHDIDFDFNYEICYPIVFSTLDSLFHCISLKGLKGRLHCQTFVSKREIKLVKLCNLTAHGSSMVVNSGIISNLRIFELPANFRSGRRSCKTGSDSEVFWETSVRILNFGVGK